MFQPLIFRGTLKEKLCKKINIHLPGHSSRDLLIPQSLRYLDLEKGSRFHHPKKAHKEVLGVYKSIYNIQELQILIKETVIGFQLQNPNHLKVVVPLHGVNTDFFVHFVELVFVSKGCGKGIESLYIYIYLYLQFCDLRKMGPMFSGWIYLMNIAT